ncbi:MAG: hypothetical protein A2653_02580 [Candidatus Zambryskibacteria bacterium RIFCSPHIGHO2_01_FULL_43_25]|uniref:Ribosomal RNA small subunit methyltransferase E n=1 Tax=Candidatus Zambryskibacteria bacterium RIFCSPLOWO2_01_FULL_45_21 TaxID=1802761 RepID=A0A1G2U713_9BACT|nr:MAG: hypothetical protein A2653_02580 [Candidatus Zambryskibacteria bacterium RIFCSPHIGHO2_01_FULL_43_25]OHB00351.1 MAG: hypothetical protein A3E94_00975 [Candidatus Zambryskibacteria bacterium RIFCSPHIGHO2_12_FULL_44_12b]OHB04742.1 MAG: hypothetical protein A3B14_03730 [Candidatus Zambryskibacteria bacterium RIFCSPLOWO2_01_FULL_45_21]
MRLHRFFVDETLEGKKDLTLSSSDFTYQLRHVFRFTVGGQLILLDNSGYEYLSMISNFGPSSVTLEIVSRREGKNIPAKELFLFCSIVKKDKFEWIVEKGTELGVSRFIPVLSDRSEKKGPKAERLNAIIKEASEQSGRATKPVLENIKTLKDAIAEDIPLFAFDPSGETFVLEHFYKHSTLGVLIGPEVGWSEQEIRMFKQNSIKIFSLGTSILKTETAALAVASLVLLS